MSRIGLLGIAVLATVGSVMGQSLNVDINRATGSGNGVPSSSYGAAAGQPGVWNNVAPGSSGTVVLVGLDGNGSGVTLTRDGGGGGSANTVPGASSDYGKLMWDYQYGITPTGSAVATLNGVDQGLYRLYVYAYLPGESGYWVDNFGYNVYHTSYISVEMPVQTVGSGNTSGPAGPDVFQEGVTHAVIDLLVPAGAPSIVVEVRTDISYDLSYCALNGLQLVKYTGSRLYVDVNATGSNNGKTWTDAFTDLQDALALAKKGAGIITEIWVADGVYYPTSGTNRSTSFQLVNGVAVYGGFAGGETQLSERDVNNDRAYLSGNIGGFLNGDNSYQVVVGSGNSSSAVLDGFWIVSGNGNGAAPRDGGGGLFIANGSPTIRNCTFLGNTAVLGGAVNIELGGPTFEGCTFYNNSADFDGGSMRYIGSSGIFAPILKIANCKFLRSTTTNGSFALYSEYGSVWLSNCLFDGAACGAFSTSGSGVYSYLDNCTVVNNHTSGGTAGVAVGSGATLYCNNSIIWGNTSDFVAGGTLGAQYSAFGTIIFDHSCVQTQYAAPVTGVGNRKDDPLFVNAKGPNNVAGDNDDDLRLSALSPLIDAGNNGNLSIDYTDLDRDGSTGEPVPLDLDGNARRLDAIAIADTGAGTAPIVDMGPYEFVSGPHVFSAVSRKTHGAAGIFDIDLLNPLPGQTVPVECRFGGASLIVVTFAEPVTSEGSPDPSDIELAVSGGGPGTVDAVAVAGNQLTIQLSGVGLNSRLTVRFPGILDAQGHPVTESICFGVLATDVDGDAGVNVIDLIGVRNLLNAPVNAASFRNDVDYDGNLNVLDLVSTRNLQNQVLPSSCP